MSRCAHARTIEPPWLEQARLRLLEAGLIPGDRVAFVRGGRERTGVVGRVGAGVLDVFELHEGYLLVQRLRGDHIRPVDPAVTVT